MQVDKLNQHLHLVLEANKDVNLTRITDWDQAQLLHVEDSLTALNAFNRAPEGRFADLGSGAGFPGIPLAIESGRTGVLVESVGKKASCLNTFIEALGLKDQLEVFSGRAEALAKEQANQFAIVTARALSSLPSLMELASPLLQEGGQLICLKSNDIEEELLQAQAIQEKLALYLYSNEEEYLSDGSTPRRIVVFEKRGEPTVQLPRREGMAQKRPYKM